MILGALLLIVTPTIIYPNSAEFGVFCFVLGFISGGIGFYLRFLKK